MAPRLQDFAQVAGRVAVALQGAPPGVSQRMWSQLGPWVRQLVMHAADKWIARATAEFPCQVPLYRGGVHLGSCSESAVTVCDVCGRSACLNHCRVDQFGDAICYGCIFEAMRRRDAAGQAPPANRGRTPWDRGGPQQPQEPEVGAPDAEQAALKAAYRLLGVRPSATDDELKGALKRKLARWHPDRFKTEAKKSEAEKQFKEAQAAYEVIRRGRDRKVAA